MKGSVRRVAGANRKIRCLVLRVWEENCKCHSSLEESVKEESSATPAPGEREREEREALKICMTVI